jgi:hypothetical protein
MKWPFSRSDRRRSDEGGVQGEREFSSGGSEFHRHDDPNEFRKPDREAVHLDDILRHLEPLLGKLAYVWHEIASNQVHVDVLVFAPRDGRPYWTLVTSGMSDRPMNAPAEFAAYGDFRRAELVMSLPADWPEMQNGAGRSSDTLSPEAEWPIGLLRYLARFPFIYDTWLWQTHTVENGNPPSPYAANTEMMASYLEYPANWPSDFVQMVTNAGANITFIAVVPIYRAELQLKLDRGRDELIARLAAIGATEILDIHRPNVALYNS